MPETPSAPSEPTKAERHAELQESYWYAVGRASAYEELSDTFQTEAGNSYSAGHDNEAHILREWAKKVVAMGKAHRERQDKIHEQMKKLNTEP